MRVAGETSHGRRASLQRANFAGPVLKREQARWRPHYRRQVDAGDIKICQHHAEEVRPRRQECHCRPRQCKTMFYCYLGKL